jgi:hypothetical protein
MKDRSAFSEEEAGKQARRRTCNVCIKVIVENSDDKREKFIKEEVNKKRRMKYEETKDEINRKRREIYRQKRLKESKADKEQRLEREAFRKKIRRDHDFDEYCKRKGVPLPSRREVGDTRTITEAKRRVSRDAVNNREEEAERKWQERMRICGGKIYLPHNAEGPGIETEEYGSKYGYGREAAAAMHSLIKDDIKNGKSTTYTYQGAGGWQQLRRKRCQGFVYQNGEVGRCTFYFEGEGNFCKCCAPSKQCQRFTYTVSHDSVKSHRCTRSVKGESCFCSKCGKDKLKEEERYLTSKKVVKKLCQAPLRFSGGEGLSSEWVKWSSRSYL